MGFPYVVMMNSRGDVLSVLGHDRSITGFDAALTEAKKNAEQLSRLSAKAKSGDMGARIELFALRLELNHLDLATARGEMQQLELTPETKEELEGRLIHLEVQEILAPVTRDPESRIAAGKKFAAMLEQGRVPSEQNDLLPFVILLLDYAEEAKDTALLEKGLALGEKELGEMQGIEERFFEPKRELLKKLQESADGG